MCKDSNYCYITVRREIIPNSLLLGLIDGNSGLSESGFAVATPISYVRIKSKTELLINIHNILLRNFLILYSWAEHFFIVYTSYSITPSTCGNTILSLYPLSF